MRESPSESREPFIGVGMILTRLLGILGMLLLLVLRGAICWLLAGWSSASSESASAIRNNPNVDWPL